MKTRYMNDVTTYFTDISLEGMSVTQNTHRVVLFNISIMLYCCIIEVCFFAVLLKYHALLYMLCLCVRVHARVCVRACMFVYVNSLIYMATRPSITTKTCFSIFYIILRVNNLLWCERKVMRPLMV